jgi:hypothetical protein
MTSATLCGEGEWSNHLAHWSPMVCLSGVDWGLFIWYLEDVNVELGKSMRISKSLFFYLFFSILDLQLFRASELSAQSNVSGMVSPFPRLT